MSAQSVIEAELSKLRAAKRLRSLDSAEGIDFTSNDFFGLSHNRELIAASCRAAKEEGVGSGASRLLGANSDSFERLERELAHFAGKESALFFSSGYTTNLAVVSALAASGAEFFIDKLCHASIYDGLKLGAANYRRYNHCNSESLAKKLARSEGELKVIITESIFSMDGDCAPLADIVQLAKEQGALLMVDEAHALGIYGATGAGLAEELGLLDKIDIYIGTLGKAAGAAGGFVASSHTIRELLINCARPFIYSTAPAPPQLAVAAAALKLLPQLRPEATELLERAALLRQLLTADTANSSSHIVPVIIGDEQCALALAAQLREQGFVVKAIRPPTVPPATARLRIVLHSYNSTEQVRQLAAAINTSNTSSERLTR